MTSTATLGRGALLEASGGVFDYVSAYRLNSWLACPLKFKTQVPRSHPDAKHAAALRGQGVPRRAGTLLPPPDARRLFAVVHEYLDALDRGRFNFRPGWGCSMCDFREVHCRRWSG
jgi:hypothetical protein